MKKFIKTIIKKLTACGICYGMGVIETGGGADTNSCPACKGKGLV